MKNTGIIYSSEEKTPDILPELPGLLPSLMEDQPETFETNILYCF